MAPQRPVFMICGLVFTTRPLRAIWSANSLTNSSVGVTNGLFAITLDFGPGVFTGPNRWLEMGVRSNGAAGPFTTLSPRQALTATPYALYATNSGLAATASGVAPGSVAAAGIASGQVVKSLNGLKDNVNLAAGANVTLATNGSNLMINSSGSGAFSLNGTNAYFNAGNVGIGTTTPDAALTLAPGRALKINDPSQSTFGTVLANDGAGNGELATFGRDLSIQCGWENTLTLGVSYFDQYGGKVVIPGGNVGIGTISPDHRLTVQGPAGGTTPITWRNPTFELGLLGWDTDANSGWVGLKSSGNYNVIIRANGSSYFNGGNVGIGTTNPKGALHIANGGLAVTGRTSPYTGAGPGIFMESDGTQGFLFAYDYGTGAPLPLRLNSPGGTVSVPVLEITGGSDLAEPFPLSNAGTQKGTLVVIDPNNPGKLKSSERAYDTRVAGVVSGANGINPGISLKQAGTLDLGENIALSGRVYALADASYASIQPGDLLTSSDTPGHCMKATDPARSQGAIIGKAMSSLKEGKGMVLVLVSLQ